MNESPSIIRVAADCLSMLYFLALTVAIRTVGPALLHMGRFTWVTAAHADRERIAFKVFTTLKEITPETYRSFRLWHLR